MKTRKLNFIMFALFVCALFSQFAEAENYDYYPTYSTAEAALYANGGFPEQTKGFGIVIKSDDLSNKVYYGAQWNSNYSNTYANIIKRSKNITYEFAVHDTYTSKTYQMLYAEFDYISESKRLCELQGAKPVTNVSAGMNWALYFAPMIRDSSILASYNFGLFIDTSYKDAKGRFPILTVDDYGRSYPSGLGNFTQAEYNSFLVTNHVAGAPQRVDVNVRKNIGTTVLGFALSRDYSGNNVMLCEWGYHVWDK